MRQEDHHEFKASLSCIVIWKPAWTAKWYYLEESGEREGEKKKGRRVASKQPSLIKQVLIATLQMHMNSETNRNSVMQLTHNRAWFLCTHYGFDHTHTHKGTVARFSQLPQGKMGASNPEVYTQHPPPLQAALTLGANKLLGTSHNKIVPEYKTSIFLQSDQSK